MPSPKKLKATNNTASSAVGKNSPVQLIPTNPPAAILRRVRDSALGPAPMTGEATAVSPIVTDRPSARVEALSPLGIEVLVVLDDPLLHVTRRYDGPDDGTGDVTSEVAVVEWRVLAAGTPLGTRS